MVTAQYNQRMEIWKDQLSKTLNDAFVHDVAKEKIHGVELRPTFNSYQLDLVGQLGCCLEVKDFVLQTNVQAHQPHYDALDDNDSVDTDAETDDGQSTIDLPFPSGVHDCSITLFAIVHVRKLAPLLSLAFQKEMLLSNTCMESSFIFFPQC